MTTLSHYLEIKTQHSQCPKLPFSRLSSTGILLANRAVVWTLLISLGCYHLSGGLQIPFVSWSSARSQTFHRYRKEERLQVFGKH